MPTTENVMSIFTNGMFGVLKIALPILMIYWAIQFFTSKKGKAVLKKWLQKRTIPRNRAYVSNFLSRLGLNEKDTKGIIDICQGLSLNDSYWVVQENCKDLFKDKNLYHNSFNTNIASIAFTGYGSYK